ncbi:GNAT family N-acetyltransferase [Halomarina rubra]|uniref:Enhanced intracellular survival protein Eis n=1 Tax=Halomarina rubra TaxID=2071873 RepID=A0ABD6ATE8_9EURY|nr:GNAT family N-acetyltransferase [Halomarina rubra]
MTLQYRAVPDEDRDEFRRLLTYAFRPTETHETVEDEEDVPAPAQPGARRGIYDGDELLCTGRHYWFTLDVRGTPLEVPGLSAVSTPPWNRRRGLVRRLLSESLEEYREREAWFSLLWPFEHPFYAKFGWATVTEYAEVSVAPDDLDFVDRVDPDGRFVELDADRWADCERVYRAANDQTLACYRTEEWWRKRVFKGWRKDPYVAGVERESADGESELVGYVVYTVDDGDDGRTLKVHERGAVDHAARVELFRFCRYHDSQVSTVELYDRPDTRLFDLVTDPRDVSIELHPGPMGRLVDVRRALEALDYPDEVDGRVGLAVTDELATWNDASYELTVEDGTATCERLDSGVATGADDGDDTEGNDADVAVDVGPLSQLAFGYRTASDLRTVGRLSADDDAVATLDALFPETTTLPPEGF